MERSSPTCRKYVCTCTYTCASINEVLIERCIFVAYMCVSGAQHLKIAFFCSWAVGVCVYIYIGVDNYMCIFNRCR